MKKIIFLFALLLSTATFSMAQNTDAKANQKAKRMERREEKISKFKAKLGISTEQETKLRAIFEESRAAKEAIRNEALTVDQRKAKAKTIEEARRQKVMAVLSPQQQEQLKAMIAERKEKGKGKGPKGGKKRGGGMGQAKPQQPKNDEIGADELEDLGF